MIRHIKINSKKYGNISLPELTKNNIFIFQNKDIKNEIAKVIEKIWLVPDDGRDDLVYQLADWCSSSELVLDTEKTNICFPTTTIANLKSGQKFIFTTEPAFVYAAKEIYDIWFVLNDSDKVYFTALCEFKGTKDDWKKGIDTIYSNVIKGCYGNYINHTKE